MHPKYTYPSFSYVLYTAYVPEIYRNVARRHPTCVHAPPVWFERDVRGRDVLVMGPVEVKSLGGIPYTSRTPLRLPFTPILQPLKVSAGDWDVITLELGGHPPIASDEQIQDEGAEDDGEEYSDSESDDDSELEYVGEETGETSETAIVSSDSGSGETWRLLPTVAQTVGAINTNTTNNIVQDLEVCGVRNPPCS